MTIFMSGMLLSLSLIIAIGPQNAHVLRMGLLRSHVGLTVVACALTDLLLIALGVAGLASVGTLSPMVHGALLGGAILFLVHYGWQAAMRALRNQYAGLNAASADAPRNRAQALGAALAFSWLNPHAWLDTAVLIGTASLAYQHAGDGYGTGVGNWVFGAGAATGSMLWFVALGLGAQALAQKLAKPAVWRALDATVAVTMWGTAGWLVKTLLA